MIDIKHIFVINPMSGKGVESKRLAGIITSACTAAGTNFEIYYTISRGDATEYVRGIIKNKPKDEIYRFYACGGDGTLSEVVSGAVAGDTKAPTDVEVGCIPIGTGNDFVRNFSNTDFFLDITKQILADAVVIDTYKYDEGRYGVNMINIGFDCDVVVRAAELKRKKLIPKKLAYIAGVVSVLRKNKGLYVRVNTEDGESVLREFQLVSAANGGWCGGGFHSAPRSVLDDGLLDVSLIDKVSRSQFIRLVGSYKKGTHLETRLGGRVVHYSAERSITFIFDRPTNVCIDGEVEQRDSITLSVNPGSLNFVVPVGCEVICASTANNQTEEAVKILANTTACE